jgi:FO synthase
MEENISRLAGSHHGVRLDPEELVAAAHRAGRPAFERDTLYRVRHRYPVGRVPESDRDVAAVGDPLASGMVMA